MDLKRVIKIIVLLSIPIMLFLSVNQLFINTYDGKLCVSYSLETSKKNELYLGLYKPLKDSIQLKNGKIKAVNAWAENSWRDAHILLFFSTIEKENGLNLIFPYLWKANQYPDFFMRTLDGKSSGNSPGLGYDFYYTNEPDTLSLIIEQKKIDSWEETIYTDTIIYKRAF